MKWMHRHGRLVDIIVAAALTAFGVAALWNPSDGGTGGHPKWWTVALAVTASAPLAWRRTNPRTTLLVLLAAQLCLQVQDIDGPGWIAVLIASFTFTTGSRIVNRGRIVAVFIASLATIVVAHGFIGDGPWRVLPGAVVLAVVMIVGDRTRRRREEAHERRVRIHERHRAAARRQLDDERTRLARELHDVIAHSVSVMVIQAAAARRQLATDPQRAGTAMANVEETGRTAMQEMRRVLGVLRTDTDGRVGGADLDPQPSFASLPELVRAAGDLPVVLSIARGVASVDVPLAVGVSTYRIVQEALTNVRRHAGRVDEVLVNVARSNGAVVIEVLDDGRGASADQGPAGFGLLGMRERVAMFAGELSAGPRSGGGWQVRASLPLGPR